MYPQQFQQKRNNKLKLLAIIPIAAILIVSGVFGSKFASAQYTRYQVKDATNLFVTDLLGGRALLAYEDTSTGSQKVIDQKTFGDVYANLTSESTTYTIKTIRVFGTNANVLGVINGKTKAGKSVRLVAAVTLVKDGKWRVDGSSVTNPI